MPPSSHSRPGSSARAEPVGRRILQGGIRRCLIPSDTGRGIRAMVETAVRGTEAWWGEYPADEWADALVAAMKLGGVDNLFFVSGSELAFFQEAIAKAEARGTPAPRLVTMMHESVALNAALGNAMVRGAPAATAVHVDVGTLHYGAAVHTAWRGNYPVLMTAGTGPRAFPDSMRGAREG